MISYKIIQVLAKIKIKLLASNITFKIIKQFFRNKLILYDFK